jgi:hypothetical protein
LPVMFVSGFTRASLWNTVSIAGTLALGVTACQEL